MFRKDPRLPTDEVLDVKIDRWLVDTEDNKEGMTKHFSEAWRLAQTEIQKPQGHQKKVYDQKARQLDLPL